MLMYISYKTKLESEFHMNNKHVQHQLVLLIEVRILIDINHIDIFHDFHAALLYVEPIPWNQSIVCYIWYIHAFQCFYPLAIRVAK